MAPCPKVQTLASSSVYIWGLFPGLREKDPNVIIQFPPVSVYPEKGSSMDYSYDFTIMQVKLFHSFCPPPLYGHLYI